MPDSLGLNRVSWHGNAASCRHNNFRSVNSADLILSSGVDVSSSNAAAVLLIPSAKCFQISNVPVNGCVFMPFGETNCTSRLIRSPDSIKCLELTLWKRCGSGALLCGRFLTALSRGADGHSSVSIDDYPTSA